MAGDVDRRSFLQRMLGVFIGAGVAPEVLGAVTPDAAAEVVLPPEVTEVRELAPRVGFGSPLLGMSATCGFTSTYATSATTISYLPVTRPDPGVDALPPPEPFS